MSVLIRGMEMPTSCRACRFAGFGGRRCELNVCMFTGESQPTLSPEHMSKCPLVPVPPHGDLIDRDATIGKIGHLADEIDKKLGYEKSASYIMMTLYLNNADEFPTIIPAEEE